MPWNTTVVRLPTAAQRQVRQRWNRWTRAERERLPQFPKQRAAWPEQRKARTIAHDMLEAGDRAALRLAVAMFRHLDDRQRSLVQMYLTVEAFGAMEDERGSASARQALAFVKYEIADTGEKHSIARAMEAICNGEAE